MAVLNLAYDPFKNCLSFLKSQSDSVNLIEESETLEQFGVDLLSLIDRTICSVSNQNFFSQDVLQLTDMQNELPRLLEKFKKEKSYIQDFWNILEKIKSIQKTFLGTPSNVVFRADGGMAGLIVSYFTTNLQERALIASLTRETAIQTKSRYNVNLLIEKGKLSDQEYAQLIQQEGSKIRVLNISNRPMLKREIIIQILKTCPFLEDVNFLEKNNRFPRYALTNDVLEVLVNFCPLVHKINLGNCAVSNIGLSLLASSYPKLSSINISWCAEVNDQGSMTLLNCLELQSVDLSDSGVSKKGILALENHCNRSKEKQI